MKPPEISPRIPSAAHSGRRRRIRGGLARASYSVDLETGLHIRAPTGGLSVDTAGTVARMASTSPAAFQPEFYRLIEYNDDDIQTLQNAYMSYITDSMHLGQSSQSSPVMLTPMPPAAPPGTPYHRARTARQAANELHMAASQRSSSSSPSTRNAHRHIFSPLVPATLSIARTESPEPSGSEEDDAQRMQRQRDLLEIMESLANMHSVSAQETTQLRARSPTTESILDDYLDAHSSETAVHHTSAAASIAASDRSCLVFSHPTLNDQIKCVCPCSRSADGEYWTPDRCLCYKKLIMETEYHCSNSHRNVPMR